MIIILLSSKPEHSTQRRRRRRYHPPQQLRHQHKGSRRPNDFLEVDSLPLLLQITLYNKSQYKEKEKKQSMPGTTNTNVDDDDGGPVRLMNDTTMPPPKTTSTSTTTTTGGRKVAVNPRQRIGGGVKKGFGLHDWKLLLKNTKDLAQRKGAAIRYNDITKEEVKLHNKLHDGWIILRGKVYNISPYIHYHPGGIDILKNVLGKDATSLFDKYHRWVNIDGLISQLLIGSIKILGGGVVPSSPTSRTTSIISTISLQDGPPRILPLPTSTTSTSLSLGSRKNSSSTDDDNDEVDPDNDDLLLPPPPRKEPRKGV